MVAGDSTPTEGSVDPVRAFADRLRVLQVHSGGPSVRDLVRLTEKVGAPYTRGTIHDKLAGRSAPAWEFVAAFVRACARNAGSTTEPDLRPWREWHAQLTRELAAQRTTNRRATRTDVCPYRGLEAFTAEYAEWFHGRNAVVQDILAGLAEHQRGLVVLGPSGAGKSSVVQAGVLPALAAGQLSGSDRWIVVSARPSKDLRSELDHAGLPGAAAEPIGTAIADRLAGEPAGCRLLLVIDQFEEMLTPTASAEQTAACRAAFDELATAVGTAGLTMVLVLRDDFYPRLASQAPELLQALAPGLLNVPAILNAQDLRDIVIRPADAVGLEFDAGLPDRIIGDALVADPDAGRARHAPITVLPLVELTLQQLWLRRESGRLTHEAYQRIGGIAGALTTWCDAAIAQLAADQRSVARHILTALVHPADELGHVPAVRQQVPLAALRQIAAGQASDQGVDEVLAALTEHRIITTRTVGQPVAELVHEALIRDWATLRDWVSQDHRFQDWLRRAGERRNRWSRERRAGDLLHGSDLAEGMDWSRERSLPDDISEFLVASRRNQRTGIRRTRIVAAVLATLLVVALTATGLALRQRQTALAAQREALSRQLAAQSTAVTDSDSDLASLLAVLAYRTSPTAEAIGSLYAAAAAPILRRLDNRDEPTAAFSPDGRLVATGDADGVIRLWEVPGGRLVRLLEGHRAAVNQLAFRPDGKALASASDDGTVRVWSLETGIARPLFGFDKPVLKVKFSRDGRTLASASDDGKIRLWEMPGGRLLATIRGGSDLSGSIDFSLDSRTLAIAGDDGLVQLQDTAGRQAPVRLGRHAGPVNAVAFSPDGRTVASASEDRTVKIWSVAGGRSPKTLTGHTDGVRAVGFSPDGRTLATGSNDHTARLWDTTSWRSRAVLTGHGDDVNGVSFSRRGDALATSGNEGIVKIWNVVDGQPRITLPGALVNAVAFSPDSKLLVTAAPNGARLWDAEAGKPRFTIHADPGNLYSVAVSPDGHTLATGGADHTVHLWNATDGHSRDVVLRGHRSDVTDVAFSRDGKTLAASGADGMVLLWKVTGGPPVPFPYPDHGVVSGIAFSRDGRLLVAGYDDGTIYIWNASGGPPHVMPGHTGKVITVAFSPDGRTVASGGEDRKVLIRKVADGATLATFDGHALAVERVAFSPDGRTLAVGDWAGVKLWDVAGKRLRRSLTGHTQRVDGVAFSPDGRTLATGSADNTARLWDVAGGQTRTVLNGHVDALLVVAFSPDGRTLTTGSWDGKVKSWNVALPTLPAAIDKICRAINRDLTPQERSLYLPAEASTNPVCP